MTEADIRRRTASGFRWAFAGKLVVQVLSWAATILVLRLLAPSDYGINAMAMVVIGLGVMVAEFGLSTALVQAKTVDDTALRTAFGFIVVLNAMILVVILALTPLVAAYFGRPEILYVLPVAALQFPIQALSSIPSALLERDLRFKEKTIQAVVASVAGTVATLAMAWLGFGYWALILGSLLNGAVGVALLNLAVPWPKRPVFRGITQSSVLRFAGAVTIGRLLWYGYSTSDTWVVGRRLGDVALGFYSVAAEIASTPLNKLAAPLTQVMTAAVSRLRDDARAAERMAVDVVHYVSTVAFPVYFGIALVADEIVRLLIGEKWLATAPVIALLALIGPLRAVSVVLSAAITASGESRLQVTTAAWACVLFPAAFLAGSYFNGVVGVAWGWVAAYPVYFLYLSRLSARVLGLTLTQVVRPMLLPLAGALGMSVCTYLAGRLAGDQLWLVLALKILAGVAAYAAFLAFFDKQMLRRLLMR